MVASRTVSTTELSAPFFSIFVIKTQPLSDIALLDADFVMDEFLLFIGFGLRFFFGRLRLAMNMAQRCIKLQSPPEETVDGQLIIILNTLFPEPVWDYELAFYREPPYSVKTYNYDEPEELS